MSAASTSSRLIAVFFGGRSPEHDISVMTGQQVMAALDPDLFRVVPVYIHPSGQWLTGDRLFKAFQTIPGVSDSGIDPVHLVMGDGGRAALMIGVQGRLFQRPRLITPDCVIPAFHGVQGEDGCFQGLMEMAGIPYAGMRVMASALLMDKMATKDMLAAHGVPLLPSRVLERPAQGLMIPSGELKRFLGDLAFPVIVKPRHLGSSIGVARAQNWDELSASLPAIFQFDTHAIIEMCVPNLVEYNVAVARFGTHIRTSAIERPKSPDALLDFKAKYLSGAGKQGGIKQGGPASQGMLSMTRDINPPLSADLDHRIRSAALASFAAIKGSGAPRIDFLCNAETGDLYLNEINPCPGSFGSFLWEAATPPLLFTGLLEHLIAEAVLLHQQARLPDDPTPEAARLFKRAP